MKEVASGWRMRARKKRWNVWVCGVDRKKKKKKKKRRKRKRRKKKRKVTG